MRASTCVMGVQPTRTHTHTHSLTTRHTHTQLLIFGSIKAFVAGYTQPTSKGVHSCQKKTKRQLSCSYFASHSHSQPDKKLRIITLSIVCDAINDVSSSHMLNGSCISLTPHLVYRYLYII